MEQKSKKHHILIMASGNGSNFESICKACISGQLNAQVLKLIGDNPDAYVFKRADKYNIPTACIDFKSFSNRAAFNENLLSVCQSESPDYIVLAGFMKILPPTFIDAFKQKIINIHPSLLPKYPGVKAMEKAWNNKDSHAGVSVHYVDKGVDTGEIIMQNSLSINYKNGYEDYCEQMHRLEHKTYVEALMQLFNAKK